MLMGKMVMVFVAMMDGPANSLLMQFSSHSEHFS